MSADCPNIAVGDLLFSCMYPGQLVLLVLHIDPRIIGRKFYTCLEMKASYNNCYHFYENSAVHQTIQIRSSAVDDE